MRVNFPHPSLSLRLSLKASRGVLAGTRRKGRSIKKTFSIFKFLMKRPGLETLHDIYNVFTCRRPVLKLSSNMFEAQERRKRDLFDDMVRKLRLGPFKIIRSTRSEMQIDKNCISLLVFKLL